MIFLRSIDKITKIKVLVKILKLTDQMISKSDISLMHRNLMIRGL